MWRWILISWSLVGLIAAGSEPADPVPTPDDDPLPTHPDLASDSSSSIRHALQSVLSGGKAFASVLRRLAPTRFSLTRVFIVFLMMTSMGMSSRTCVDHRVPVRSATPFTFCTDYSGSEACLAPIGSRFVDGLYPSEATIAAAFTGITFSQHPGSCPDLVRRLMCAAAADPWSSTLSSDGSAPIPIPKHLCPALSSLIWDQCKDVAMTPNPFDIVARTHPSRQTLRRLFSSAKSFADAFRSPGRDCYAGVPVDQTKAQPRLPSSPKSDYIGQVCLKRLKFAIGSTFYLGGAPFPNDRSRMAIVDKNGIVQIWQIGDLEIIPAAAPWLDLSSQIVSDGQHGLLSLAFHKQFASNGRLFLSMTCDISNDRCHKDGDLVVDEYRVADPSKFTTPIFQKRLLYVDGAFGHSIGGQLLFSPADTENNLFVVIGDGGHDQQQDVPDPLNHGQDLRSLRGKILRLDIDSSSNGYSPYQIPADNPYVGVTDAREEIYAMGFKNPWRCSFDRKHPEFLFCGDLGQHDYEEMDRIIKGGNYGWRFYQGRHTQDTSNGLGPEPIVFPQFEYVHPGKGGPAAIIGGYVYRPETRSTIDGTYIFGDQFGKLMTAIAVPESGVYRLTPAAGVWRCAKDSPVDCGNDIGFVLSFFETTDGAVYVCTSKAIYKISDPDSCSLN